ncbi:hypothetical protein GCM10028791_09640 [Echinicola sediminis]
MNKISFLLVALIGIMSVYQLNAQVLGKSKKIEVSMGPTFHSNGMNEDYYYDFKLPSESIRPESEILEGVNLKFSISTKKEYMDLVFGTILEWGASTVNRFSSRTSFDYKINGGGVYAGVSPKLKGKHFGLTSEFALGVFSYKETIVAFDDGASPPIDIYDKRNSHGLGALSSVGFYVKFGDFGINPNLNAIFSGGDNTSFIFYGLTIPITYNL